MTLLTKPPTIALLLLFLLQLLPIAAYEPAMEPYLTSAPYNLSVQQVGVFFVLVAAIDISVAAAAPALDSIGGSMPVLYLASLLGIGGNVLLGVGPMVYGAVLGGFAIISYGTIPVMVLIPPLLIRICHTYDLDAKVRHVWRGARAIAASIWVRLGARGQARRRRVAVSLAHSFTSATPSCVPTAIL